MNVFKPHYRWNTEQGKLILMTNDLTPKADQDVIPDWMRAKSTGAKIGNLGADDIKPPQIKLLQASSPETAEQPNAKAGCFWLAGLNIDLGPEVIGTPIILKRTYVIWNPTKSSESKVPLAVASDAIHWDVPNQTFEVRYPNNPTVYTWKIGKTVIGSGLDQFGSSRPEDRRSTPAASLTFQILWAFRLPDGRPQLGVVTLSRSGLKPARELFAMSQGRGIDHYFQRYRMCAVRIKRGEGEYYFSYRFLSDGLVQDEAECDTYKAMYERFLSAGFGGEFRDEDEDEPAPTKAGAREFAPVNVDDDIQF